MTITKHHLTAVLLTTLLACPFQENANADAISTDENSPTINSSVQSPAESISVLDIEADEERLRQFASQLPLMGSDLKVGEAILFDLNTGQRLRTYRRYKSHLRHVRFSPKSNQAMLGFLNFNVVWNSATGVPIREIDVGGIAHYSPDSSSVLVYDTWQARRFDTATGKQIETIALPRIGTRFKSGYAKDNAHLPNIVRHDPSGTLIYNVAQTNVQRILDANSGKQVGICPWTQSYSCLVSGATRSVYEGGHMRPFNVVRIFNFEQKEIRRFDMATGEVPGIYGRLEAISPNGKKFIYSRNVKNDDDPPDIANHFLRRNYALYDAQTGKELRMLGEFVLGYVAAFSPDGQHTILLPTFGNSAEFSRDPEIIVLNNATGKVEHRFYSGPWAISSVDFDHTGTKMIVAGSIYVDFWRRFYEWRQLEQQSPMPRKVADLLRIIRDWKSTEEE